MTWYVNLSCTRGFSSVLGHSNSNNTLFQCFWVFFQTPCILLRFDSSLVPRRFGYDWSPTPTNNYVLLSCSLFLFLCYLVHPPSWTRSRTHCERKTWQCSEHERSLMFYGVNFPLQNDEERRRLSNEVDLRQRNVEPPAEEEEDDDDDDDSDVDLSKYELDDDVRSFKSFKERASHTGKNQIHIMEIISVLSPPCCLAISII